VPQAVARALMITEAPGRPLAETLARDLASTEMLLVLDNCEQARSYLADNLLRSCPDLKILATIRETLGIAGERAWLVPVLFGLLFLAGAVIESMFVGRMLDTTSLRSFGKIELEGKQGLATTRLLRPSRILRGREGRPLLRCLA
jgi:hypothetical protein